MQIFVWLSGEPKFQPSCPGLFALSVSCVSRCKCKRFIAYDLCVASPEFVHVHLVRKCATNFLYEYSYSQLSY